MDICGVCGTSESDSRNALCALGHDAWLQLEDFENPELFHKIEVAAKRFGFKPNELKQLMVENKSIVVLFSTYISNYANGASLRNHCKYNPFTNTVFDIVPNDTHVQSILTNRSVELPDGTILTEFRIF